MNDILLIIIFIFLLVLLIMINVFPISNIIQNDNMINNSPNIDIILNNNSNIDITQKTMVSNKKTHYPLEQKITSEIKNKINLEEKETNISNTQNKTKTSPEIYFKKMYVKNKLKSKLQMDNDKYSGYNQLAFNNNAGLREIGKIPILNKITNPVASNFLFKW